MSIAQIKEIIGWTAVAIAFIILVLYGLYQIGVFG